VGLAVEGEDGKQHRDKTRGFFHGSNLFVGEAEGFADKTVASPRRKAYVRGT
jgi:hypothetical protein